MPDSPRDFRERWPLFTESIVFAETMTADTPQATRRRVRAEHVYANRAHWRDFFRDRPMRIRIQSRRTRKAVHQRQHLRLLVPRHAKLDFGVSTIRSLENASQPHQRHPPTEAGEGRPRFGNRQ